MEKYKEPTIERRDSARLLGEYIGKISEEINNEMEKSHGVENFLAEDGRINMQSYSRRVFVWPEVYKNDTQSIKEYEQIFSQDFREKNFSKLGLVTDEEIVREWKLAQEKKPSHQLELLMMGLFHRFFGDRFLVVRASTFDDYSNGVDMIIIDKKNGELICAIDEVNDDPRGHRTAGKWAKITERMAKGGTRLKYGFRVRKDGEKDFLEEKELKNLPIFYLSAKSDELENVISGMNPDFNAEPSLEEFEMMEKVLDALASQGQEMKEMIGAGSKRHEGMSALQDNLDSATARIEFMKLLFRKRKMKKAKPG